GGGAQGGENLGAAQRLVIQPGKASTGLSYLKRQITFTDATVPKNQVVPLHAHLSDRQPPPSKPHGSPTTTSAGATSAATATTQPGHTGKRHPLQPGKIMKSSLYRYVLI